MCVCVCMCILASSGGNFDKMDKVNERESVYYRIIKTMKLVGNVATLIEIEAITHTQQSMWVYAVLD